MLLSASQEMMVSTKGRGKDTWGMAVDVLFKAISKL